MTFWPILKNGSILLRPENIISWYHNGENIIIRSQSELLEKLSSIMDLTFGGTPYINNEMINRFTPNCVSGECSQKVSLGILENGMDMSDWGSKGKTRTSNF